MKRILLLLVLVLMMTVPNAAANTPGTSIGILTQLYTEDASDFIENGLGVNVSYESRSHSRWAWATYLEYAAAGGDVSDDIKITFSGLDLSEFDYSEFSLGIELRRYVLPSAALFGGVGVTSHEGAISVKDMISAIDETGLTTRLGLRLADSSFPLFASVEYRKYGGDAEHFEGYNVMLGFRF